MFCILLFLLLYYFCRDRETSNVRSRLFFSCMGNNINRLLLYREGMTRTFNVLISCFIENWYQFHKNKKKSDCLKEMLQYFVFCSRFFCFIYVFYIFLYKYIVLRKKNKINSCDCLTQTQSILIIIFTKDEFNLHAHAITFE